jgi:hypothetical protein
MMGRISTFFLSMFLAGSIAWAQDADDGDLKTSTEDQVIPVSSVPAFVMATAQQAVPGMYVTQVTRQVQNDDTTRYRLDASQVGRFWVIVVRDDGVLLEKYESAGPPALGSDAG